MTEQPSVSKRGLIAWYRKLPRFSKLVSTATATVAVAGFVLTVANFVFGISLFQNPSEHYRAELVNVARPIVDASYALLAEPGVTEGLRSIQDIPQRRAAMEAIFTKYIHDNHLEGKLEQAVNTYDLIAKCHDSWTCHIDDYEALKDQMINVWFSYAGKIRQMRGSVAGSDFGTRLEKEARRLRAEQKAEIG